MADFNALTPSRAEEVLLSIYTIESAKVLNFALPGLWFPFIGLPRDATWEAFRAHYKEGSVVDAQAALRDQMAYPPSFREMDRRLLERGLAKVEQEGVLNAG